MTNDRLKGFTYGALAAASYGLNPLFALPLYGAGMKVDSVLFYRYFFAIVMLGILMKVKKQSFALKKTDILPLAVMGLLFSFSSLFLFESYNYMDAGIASTILFVYPVMVAIIMAIFFHEKVSFITMFSIALAFTGISLLYEGGESVGCVVRHLVFADVCHIYSRCEPFFPEKSANGKADFLCFAVRNYHLCGTFGFLYGLAACTRSTVVGECVFVGIVSYYYLIDCNDAFHSSYRLHAGCHSGSIGTCDGAVLRSSGVW